MVSRTVILHYHLFKNAGTSLDKNLKDNFPGQWVAREFPAGDCDHASMIAEWITETPDAVAFSTHTGIGPLPRIPDVRIISVMFLRDPLERIRSAYNFERNQDTNTLGAVLARTTDLAGYVRCRLALPGDRQCRNFQTQRLASFAPGQGTEYERALKGIAQLSFVGFVADFDGSMRKFSELLRSDFPDYKYEPVHLNQSMRHGAHADSEDIDPETLAILVENNQEDLKLLGLPARKPQGAILPDPKPNRLRSLIGLIGPPRSGTTLIANAMLSHSEVTGIIEPFQTRRLQDYIKTDFATMLDDFGVDCSGNPHLIVKETTTRQQNASLTMEMLKKARDRGLYTGLVIVLRCPFSAYLSQVEASQTLWKETKLPEVSEETFSRFAKSLRNGLLKVCLAARAQHYRMVSYEAFCKAPADELARLMALIPLRLERQAQLSFRPPQDTRPGGDPKTRTKRGRITPTPRDEEVAEVICRFAGSPEERFCQQLRGIVLRSVCREPDSVALDRLTGLLLQQESF